MCGIAGYIGPREVSPGRVDDCLALMGRRGPDATGVFRHEFNGRNVCLLHSRLSIIDLDERAGQPFRLGSRVLAANGELYNYVELAASLAARGRVFRTRSDTEVLLTVLDEYGASGLDKCEGMWAFALYDEADGSLVLCRDRFGEKPLWLHRDGGGLWFGSETRFLAALSGKKFEVDHRHLNRYLANGYKSLFKTKDTFFKGLSRLAPGTVLRLDAGGGEKSQTYWTPGFGQDESMSFADAVHGAGEALAEAVRIRLRSDVPLAFCMSGGVDSNALISIAKRTFGHDVHGFTFANTDERYAEKDMVDRAVAELGIRHTYVPADTSEFLSNLRRVVRHHGAPLSTISYYAHWLLMKSVSDCGYKVSVSGSAADELFSGYFDHHTMYLQEVAGDPERFETALVEWEEHVAPMVRNPNLKDPYAYVRDPGRRGHIFMDAERYAGFLKTGFDEPFSEESYCPGLLRNRMLNELFHEVVPQILHDDDLNSMYFSIENRSPFLDRGLFEFCQTIPTRHLIGDGYAKKVLREAVRGVAPDAIVDCRRKVGFNAPIFSFIDPADPETRAEIMDDGPIYEHVRREAVEGLLSRESLSNADSKFLFSFLCAKMFLEELGS